MSLCRIVVAGEALVDLVAESDGERLRAHLGGGPFNTARTLARLGADAVFLGALSGDAFGRRLRAALVDDGVALDLAVASERPTTLALAELNPGGATYRFYADATSAPDLAAAVLPADTAMLHVGSLGLVLEPLAATLRGLVAGLGPARPLVMVDPNCRPDLIPDRAAFRAMLDALLAGADVVKASRDDLAWLDPARDPLATATALCGLGPAVVLMTDGPGGAWIVTAGAAPVHVAAPPVDVVDTIGAGDAFSGGWLAAWARAGFDPADPRAGLTDLAALEEATRVGCLVAARTCERAGADPPRAAAVGL